MSTTVTVASADAGKLLLRLAVGILVLLHGIAKVASGPAFVVGLVEKIGMPGAFGYAVYLGEVIAPLAMILGLWTRVAALIVALNMVVAVLLVHMGEIFTLTKTGGWALELQGMFLFTALAVAMIGPGRYALMRD
ncbi:MAG TPA: DoxX family protein [Burkholderiales bacterium]|jgi:putative oxidoreductase